MTIHCAELDLTMPTARSIYKILPPVTLALGSLALSTGARAAGFATARFGGEHGSVVTTNPRRVKSVLGSRLIASACIAFDRF